MKRKVVTLLAGVALILPALVTPTQGASPQAESSARSKISMKPVGAVTTGAAWKVKGKITGTGKAKNKTLFIDWNNGSGWRKIGTKKKVGDGRYTVKFSSATPGVSQLRARVVKNGRTLAKSSSQGLTIIANTTAAPAPVGGNLRSGLTGQVNQNNPLMKDYMENVYANIDNYWRALYASWWGPQYAPTLNHYFPQYDEVINEPCNDFLPGVDNTAAYYCGPAADWMIFSQAAAVGIWNGSYAGSQSAQPGDFALAMAIAHEYGHNIFYELYPNGRDLFTLYQREGFADCLAGTWANSVYYQGLLEQGDIEEALYFLIGFGYSSVGYPSGEQRAEYFALGYNSGAPNDCINVIL